ncbi:VLRF1 family aeRF1-type release factor [Virgibacillus sediminis]|uniref:VLRF1 family aeRF1-type release factor n=1 Tax=Virgibacillus sediminis TaxID=202260 RepID=A0ABV7A2C0_9BACI
MDLNKELEKLRKIRKEGANKVFSMYLNTDPSDPDQQGGEWKIHLKNGLKNFEQYMEEDGDKEELKNYQQVKQKVEKFVRGNEQNFKKGIVLFATADEEVWFADRVQMPLETEFYWEETPVLDQLSKLSERYPKAGIILVQQNEIKVIDAYLNEIEGTISYELDLDTEDWREKLGPRDGLGTTGKGSTNLQVDNFRDRFEENKHRWYKKIAPKLDKRAKENEWEKIYVVGEADQAKELKNLLNKPVDEVIQKNMLDHEESKIIKEIFG